jgi:hypothetical protein
MTYDFETILPFGTIILGVVGLIYVKVLDRLHVNFNRKEVLNAAYFMVISGGIMLILVHFI